MTAPIYNLSKWYQRGIEAVAKVMETPAQHRRAELWRQYRQHFEVGKPITKGRKWVLYLWGAMVRWSELYGGDGTGLFSREAEGS